ncbi:hypothetical protein MCAV_02940 [[Mycoplasma] cavipharyngis]|uniref:hypothetical protein n=1 Tax=[Mycoplasma] cavipharyngis TaxID=92757 RepID=UPI0037042994
MLEQLIWSKFKDHVIKNFSSDFSDLYFDVFKKNIENDTQLFEQTINRLINKIKNFEKLYLPNYKNSYYYLFLNNKPTETIRNYFFNFNINKINYNNTNPPKFLIDSFY